MIFEAEQANWQGLIDGLTNAYLRAKEQRAAVAAEATGENLAVMDAWLAQAKAKLAALGVQ